MERIIKGETHCDTIGDIFKNRVLLKLIHDRYEIKYNTRNFKIWQDRKKKIFSSDFYDFIKNIFSAEEYKEDFISYIRFTLLEDDAKLYQEIQKKYSEDDLVHVILSFEELYNTLTRVDRSTIGSIFSSKIIDILRYYDSGKISSEEGTEENTLVVGLYNAFNNGILPITPNGEFICRISEGEGVDRVVTLGNTEEAFEVSKDGTPIEDMSVNTKSNIIIEGEEEVLDSREKLIQRIELYERIIAYHNGKITSDEITEEDEKFYIERQISFRPVHIPGDGIFYDNCLLIRFGLSLAKEKKELEKQLKATLSTDKSKIEEWEKIGIKPGITTELPSGENIQPLIQKTTGFRVIK